MDELAGRLENAEHILAGNPGDFRVFLPEYKRIFRYGGTAIEYDMRYVFDIKESDA